MAEFLYDFRQSIARLGMGGGDGERAAVTIGVLLADLAQILGFGQQALDDLDYGPSRFGEIVFVD